MNKEQRRFWALDGLRGVAALAVVAYHYLYRGPLLYPELGPPHHSIQWGQYGVQLFFIISGIVIFNSVRSSDARTFILNRAIRLYPAYWLAVILTFVVVLAFGLPGRETTWPNALFNLTMLAGFFRVPYVDGAYWTLAVELTFYSIVVVLSKTRALSDRFIFFTLFTWLGVTILARATGYALKEMPVIELLAGLAVWMPVFIIGIALNIGYQSGRWGLPTATIIASIAVVVPGNLEIAAPLTASTVLAVSALYLRAPRYAHKISNYLGELSYPVYLIHQNLGYVVLLALAAAGLSQAEAVTIALALAVTIGTLIAYCFDIPARRQLRRLVSAQRR